MVIEHQPEPDTSQETSSRRKPVFSTRTLLIVLSAGLVALVALGLALSPMVSLVPNVRGSSVDDARAALEEAGFLPGEVVMATDYDAEKYDINQVVGLSRGVYTIANEGATIDIHVAAGEAVAMVNGEPIRAAELEAALEGVKKANPNAFTSENGAQRELEFKRLLLTGLIDAELVHQAAREQGIEISEDAVQQQIETMKGSFDTEEKFLESIGNAGLTLEMLEDQIRDQLMTQQLLATLEVDTEVTAKDVKKFYEENEKLFPGQDLDEARAQIEDILVQQRRAEAYEQYKGELRSKASIEILDKELEQPAHE